MNTMNIDTTELESYDSIKLRSLENSKHCPFRLGDRVYTKRLGFPITGFIGGIYDGISYLHIHHQPDSYVIAKRTVDPYDIIVLSTDHNVLYLHWAIYPSWPLKPVCLVRFDHPTKIYTSDEMRIYRPDLTEYELKELFDKQPIGGSSSYPMDDLELINND